MKNESSETEGDRCESEENLGYGFANRGKETVKSESKKQWKVNVKSESSETEGDRCESEEKPLLWICKQRKRNSEKWKLGRYLFSNRGKETVKSEGLVVIFLQTEGK